jgi:hypothetical protein
MAQQNLDKLTNEKRAALVASLQKVLSSKMPSPLSLTQGSPLTSCLQSRAVPWLKSYGLAAWLWVAANHCKEDLSGRCPYRRDRFF